MAKKIVIMMLTLLVSMSAFAQNTGDSIVTLFDDLKVPLVEKKYVANTNFQDNWFVTLYGGVVSNFGSDDSHSGFFRLMGPAAVIAVGKDLTPISSARLGISYGRNTGVTDDQFGIGKDGVDYRWMEHNRFKWNSYGLSIDYLLNFTNLILGFRENRKLNLQGIVGIGGSVSRNYTTSQYALAQSIDNSHDAELANKDKYDNRQHSLIHLRGGLLGTIRLARNWNLNVEAVCHILDNSFDSNPTTNNTWDGHIDYLLGVSYRFNNKGGQAPGFYYPRHDMTEYIRQMRNINETRDKTRRRRQELEEMTDTIDVDAQVMYTLIAFDENDTAIDRLQQTNIYTTAYAWAKTPRSFIYITNSTGVDDKLFRKRAEAIRDILLERYEIPASRIRVIASEKDIQPVGDYIELIVND
ncbi:MAG: hypothetical protein J6T38_07670 [Bacteroidaceae bacterium]|nr:hypothetical protein [Bacteroidaceae bacterium]